MLEFTARHSAYREVELASSDKSFRVAVRADNRFHSVPSGDTIVLKRPVSLCEKLERCIHPLEEVRTEQISRLIQPLIDGKHTPLHELTVNDGGMFAGLDLYRIRAKAPFIASASTREVRVMPLTDQSYAEKLAAFEKREETGKTAVELKGTVAQRNLPR